ncbi:hypothetical protein JB92DRAFT_3286396 [Gautieria morchelliformis]|nr:hypothetical protein JB92DRAFT_3286396 [Gautieria morchelliformis]
MHLPVDVVLVGQHEGASDRILAFSITCTRGICSVHFISGHHDKVAAALRVSQALKRSRTKAKAKATRAANKQKRNIASQENDGNRLNILGDDVPGEGPEDLDSDDDHVCQDPDEDTNGGGDPDADCPIIRSTRARPVKRRCI